MAASKVIEAIRTHGLSISADNGNLHVWPKDRITPEMRATIRSMKTALLDFIDDYEERAAIMEYDGGMSRTEAEAAALECVMEKSRT